MEASANIPPACPPRPREPVRPEVQPSNKSPRGAPPIPTPYPSSSSSSLPRKPAPSSPPPPVPSPNSAALQNGAPPTNAVRKPAPSGPPPIPSRVDLGEEPPGNATRSIKQQSGEEFIKKGSPKLRAKGRPEITVVSARPMDSPEAAPHPAMPPSRPPASSPEVPKLPQKPARKAKGREPPPRPKTRPVSELVFAADEKVSGPPMDRGKSAEAEIGEVDRRSASQSSQGLQGSAEKSGPVAPTRKKPNRSSKPEDDEKSGNVDVLLNSDKRLESRERTDGGIEKEDELVRTPVVNPTFLRGNVTENSENEFKSSSENNEVDGTKDMDLNNTVIESKVEEAAVKKKNRPTVIIARPPRKTESAKGMEQQKETSEEKDLIEVKPKPVATESVKPPPPAKKPKPLPPVKPDVRPKPSNKPETPSEEPVKANESLSKLDNVAGLKPKTRPTVISAKPPKTVDAPKLSDSESVRGKDGDRSPEVKTVTVAESETVKEQREEERPASSPRVKPRHAPTVIRAPRPDRADGDAKSPEVVRKPPKRPTRGPSIKRPPPRPTAAPSEEVTEQDGHATTGKESEPEIEKTLDKKPKPTRPVSMPAFKDDVKKKIQSPLSDEESPALTRKGSRKRPPPPRPPSVEPAAERPGSVSPARDQLQSPDGSPKANAKPRPPRPASYAVDEKRAIEDSSEDKSDVILSSKSKPARPSPVQISESNVTDEAGPKKERTDVKAKPDRPPSVASKETVASEKAATEARTAGESSRDDHVQDKPGARDSVPEVAQEEQEVKKTSEEERTKTKAKPKPARPPSASFSAKNKPHRPSAPRAKSSKETKEVSNVTQVSSVCKTYIEPSAIALYDYEPSSVEDLSFSAGDEISLVKRLDEEWYIGRLGDQEGMFPVKFVEIIEDLPQETEPVKAQEPTPETSPYDVMALYDFHGNEQDGELVFTAGDIIHVLDKINNDWLRGESRGKTGSFPRDFVDITSELLDKLPPTVTDHSISKGGEEPSCPDAGLSDASSARCKALFDYHSNVAADLSFSAGDIIALKTRVSEEWLEGELDGRVGMFPSSYVEIIEDLKKEERTIQQAVQEPQVKFSVALYDFTGTSADELSFKKGDKIHITETVSDEWLRGRMGGNEGMFPRAFVDFTGENAATSETTKIPASKSKSKHTDEKLTPKAKALFDFDGETQDELSFKAGDVIFLLERVNDEWLRGELDNKLGRFPAAFVEIVTPLP